MIASTAPNTWTPLAVDFFTHPKVCNLAAAGKLLYLASLCYAQRHLTDGLIPTGALPVLVAEAGASRAQANALVTVGLWDKADDGWAIHDWAKWNQPAVAIEERREQDRARKKAWRDAKAAKKGTGQSTSRPTSRPPSRDADATRQSRSTQTQTQTHPPTPLARRDAPGEATEEEDPPLDQLLDATWALMARQLTGDAITAGEANPRNRAAYEATVATNLADQHTASAERITAGCVRRLEPWELAERLDPRCGPDDGGLARAQAAAERTRLELEATAAAHPPGLTDAQRAINNQLRDTIRAHRQHQEATP